MIMLLYLMFTILSLSSKCRVRDSRLSILERKIYADFGGLPTYSHASNATAMKEPIVNFSAPRISPRFWLSSDFQKIPYSRAPP